MVMGKSVMTEVRGGLFPQRHTTGVGGKEPPLPPKLSVLLPKNATFHDQRTKLCGTETIFLRLSLAGRRTPV